MSSISGVSPFPPIAEYAFLSNCHTGALVAPDGSVDWLCVPSFDSPSVFGSLLDRGSGYFRFGPYGINVPTSRTYVPGTNVLMTTWHTPSGWLEVREALTMAPRRGPDETTPHTRPPADDDAEHLLVRTAVCLAAAWRWRRCASRRATTAGHRVPGSCWSLTATQRTSRPGTPRCGCTAA